jgi:hypothetical protein
MFRLATMLYSLIATSISGAAVIAVLAAGYVSWMPILGAAVLGAVLALPASYLVARAIVQK